MNQISLLIRINASLDEVFEKISTVEGIEEWFCKASFSRDEESGELRLQLWGDTDFRITEMSAPTLMAWQCTSQENPWYRHDIVFKLKHDSGKTVVVFDHFGWPDISEFYRDCATSWAYFLESLRSSIEDGVGTPEEIAPECDTDST